VPLPPQCVTPPPVKVSIGEENYCAPEFALTCCTVERFLSLPRKEPRSPAANIFAAHWASVNIIWNLKCRLSRKFHRRWWPHTCFTFTNKYGDIPCSKAYKQILPPLTLYVTIITSFVCSLKYSRIELRKQFRQRPHILHFLWNRKVAVPFSLQPYIVHSTEAVESRPFIDTVVAYSQALRPSDSRGELCSIRCLLQSSFHFHWHHISPDIYFNIILPSMLSSSKQTLPKTFKHHLRYACRVSSHDILIHVCQHSTF